MDSSFWDLLWNRFLESSGLSCVFVRTLESLYLTIPV